MLSKVPQSEQTSAQHTASGSFLGKNGNKAPFFQPKPTVNTPGDEYEKEADAIADQVMRMPSPLSGAAGQGSIGGGQGNDGVPVSNFIRRKPIPLTPIQRKCTECEKEEKEGVQRKEKPGAGFVGTDRVIVQRKCAECEKEAIAQRKENSVSPSMGRGRGAVAGGQSAPPIVSDVLSSGGGRPLDGDTKGFMESRFRQDFSQVRIHTDSRAAESAAAIQAKAYTSGRDVVFGAGEYQPASESGKRLLAHELVHVGQQGKGNYNVHRYFSPERGAAGAGIGLLGGGLLGAGIGAGIGALAGNVGLGAAIGGITGALLGGIAGALIGGYLFNPDFDASIDHRIRTLTLTMRVKFEFAGAWPSDADKQHWISEYIRIVESRWSYRFYLVKVSGNCPDVQSDVYFSRLNIVPDDRDPHYDMTVNYAPGRQDGSYVNQYTNHAEMHSNDINTRTDIPQIVAEHETGHMLGLPHVRCDTNAHECYGVTAQEQSNVMGMGGIVSERDYTPFVQSIERLTGCTWRASQIMPPAPERETVDAPRPEMGDFPLPAESNTAVA